MHWAKRKTEKVKNCETLKYLPWAFRGPGQNATGVTAREGLSLTEVTQNERFQQTPPAPAPPGRRPSASQPVSTGEGPREGPVELRRTQWLAQGPQTVRNWPQTGIRGRVLSSSALRASSFGARVSLRSFRRWGLSVGIRHRPWLLVFRF